MTIDIDSRVRELMNSGLSPAAAASITASEVAQENAGVNLAFQLRGPYPIAWDTAGLVNPDGQGLVLDTFADLSIILNVYADIVTPFDASAQAVVEWGDPDDWDSTATGFYNGIVLGGMGGVETVEGQLNDGTVTDGVVANLNFHGAFRHMIMLHAPYNSFGLYIRADEGISQGAADIYVVLAIPAS